MAGLAMRRSFAPLSLALSAALALSGVGCGGGDEVPEDVGKNRRATLRVVVWSSQVQRAVPATGTITGVAEEGFTREVDTRANPAEGQSLTGLPPGPYRIKIVKRYDGAKAVTVEGVEEVYLEPGADAELSVVVIDRGELGRVLSPRTGSTDVASSPLPLTALRTEGPS